MSISWSSYALLNPAPPLQLQPWLLAPGSFMQRLRQKGGNQSRVKVVRQHRTFVSQQESKLLNIACRQYALVREVVIGNKSETWMFARTIFPLQTLTGKERLLAHLKSRALGTILFKNPKTIRSPFEFTCLGKGNPMYQNLQTHIKITESFLWARRSLFYLNHKPLLLTEVFLSDLKKLS